MNRFERIQLQLPEAIRAGHLFFYEVEGKLDDQEKQWLTSLEIEGVEHTMAFIAVRPDDSCGVIVGSDGVAIWKQACAIEMKRALSRSRLRKDIMALEGRYSYMTQTALSLRPFWEYIREKTGIEAPPLYVDAVFPLVPMFVLDKGLVEPWL